MSDLEDNLETTLHGHFRSELDAYIGRAEAGFMRQIANARVPSRHWRLMIWAAGGAVAAMVGLAWGLVVHQPRTADIAKTPATFAVTDPVVVDRRIPLERSIAYQTADGGAVVFGEQGPARAIRRQVIEKMSWYDPDHHEKVEVTLPSEQVVFVGTPTF